MHNTELLYIAVAALCAAQTALITALLVQRSGRQRAEHALRTSETALGLSYREAKRLAGRLIAAQESERYRLARDLHDNLSQKLALICIDIERVALRASFSPAAIAEWVADLLERAKDLAGDVHCLAHDLHPPRLELLGLAPAIEGLCRDVSRQCDVRIEFRKGVAGQRVPADAALCLFRITQEALQNVVKHSGATAATVRLTQTGQDVCLDISDGGKGFERTSNDGDGLGLLSMRERVHFAGGRISIRTAADRGTRIVVTLPMNREPDRPSEGINADLPLRTVAGGSAGTYGAHRLRCVTQNSTMSLGSRPTRRSVAHGRPAGAAHHELTRLTDEAGLFTASAPTFP